jgi:uncharacterized Tic20 family protein
MSEQKSLTQDEKTLAGLAHGSVLLGIFTNGVGGIVAALVIWVLQREKSAYAAGQALQALVYQALTFLVTMLAWCCWGILYTVMILVPIAGNPGAYDAAPPASLWIGLGLMIIPIVIWGVFIVYGLYGAARCFGGHDFQYAIVGKWLEKQR